MKKMQKLAKPTSVGSLSWLFIEEDIMTEIFLWLPLKSLNQFKRLSKRWYFLISHKDSYFRRNYFSTLSTRRKNNRIVGSDDNSAIMAGFFYRKQFEFGISYDVVRFLPDTSTQCKKYSFLTEPKERSTRRRGGESRTTTTTTDEIININKINPFLYLKESLDEFLSARLREDEESYPSFHEDKDYERKLFLAASSNGFLLFTLITDYFLINPVTMEWLALPQLEATDSGIVVGFVCKGDYPSLDLVEYTVVRLSWLEEELVHLVFQLFSNGGDKEWSEYKVSCKSLVEFDLYGKYNSVIVSTQGGGSGGDGSRILLYFLVVVRLTRAIAIVAIDLNVGDESLQMFETPGPDRGHIVYNYCDDYIREFDDGVIHYVRFCNCTEFSRSVDFEFWVLNTESGEWYLKHRASLKPMMMRTGTVEEWDKASVFRRKVIGRHRIHEFHPMNPNLIFLTLFCRFVCYNIKTGISELVFDFDAQDMMDDYSHFIYQWPCWPPLL